MRKARFTGHQIIAVLKSVKVGPTVKDVCREAGISEAWSYNWKAKFGGTYLIEVEMPPIMPPTTAGLQRMQKDRCGKNAQSTQTIKSD